MTRLFRIDARRFTAGLVVEGTKVARTAPILHYMKGWELSQVQRYTTQKRWALEELRPTPR